MKSLVVTPSTTDPISFYRGAHPLRRLRQSYDYDFEFTDAVNWSTISNVDNVFLHRGFIPQHAEVAQICKNWGMPIWGDYDDWLLGLTIDNPAYSRFDGNRDAIKKCMAALDLCFATTEHLAQLLRNEGVKNVVVAPNAYDHRLFEYARRQKERLKICLWRGSSTHNHDLLSVLPGLEDIFKKHSDWHFIFAGHNPSWLFKEKHANVHYVEPKSTLDYMQMIWDIAPSVVYHPLTATDFNRAKSMCSWLEATHAGAAFLAPAFDEFVRPGITNYEAENSQSFFEKMDALLSDPNQIKDNVQASMGEIAQNFTLEKVNEIRWKALCDL